MNSNTTTTLPEPREPVSSAAALTFNGLQRFLSVVITALYRWQDRVRQRRHLRELPRYRLDDIGFSPQDIEYEVRKPFWLA